MGCEPEADHGKTTQAATDAGARGSKRTLETIGLENLGKPRMSRRSKSSEKPRWEGCKNDNIC